MRTDPQSCPRPPAETGAIVPDEVREYLRRQREGLVPNTRLRQAWEQFYQVCAEALDVLAQRSKLPADDAAEVVEEVRMQLLKELPELGGPNPVAELRRWLARVFASKMANLFRCRARHPERSLVEALAASAVPPNPADDPAERYERERLSRLVRAELQHPRHQHDPDIQALRMYCLEERSVDDIARTWHSTPSRVRASLGRGRRKLRAALAKDLVG